MKTILRRLLATVARGGSYLLNVGPDGKGVIPEIAAEYLFKAGEWIKKKVRWMENFGEWVFVTQADMLTENGKVKWTVNVYEPGRYFVDARFKGKNRQVWRLTTDEGALVQNRFNAVMKYVDDELGIVEFEHPGKHTLTVSLLKGHRPSASLESIKLYPVE